MDSPSDGPAGAEGFRRLVEASRNGSPEAIGQLLESCRRYLLTIAQEEIPQTVQPRVAASDVVQETFLEAHRDFPTFIGQSEQELRGWLRRMLLHNLMDVIRKHQQTAKRNPGPQADAGSPSQRQAIASAPADDPTPSAWAIAQEKNAQLAKALEKLPQDYRAVILLRYQDGKSFEAIAGELQRSVDAVRKLWLRGVKRLQQILEESGHSKSEG